VGLGTLLAVTFELVRPVEKEVRFLLSLLPLRGIVAVLFSLLFARDALESYGLV
jgi:hypothetical protein